MTAQQYAHIAAACDRLLRAPDTGLARIAIAALHFLNEHPSSIAQYAPVLNDDWNNGLFDASKTVIRALRGLTRSMAAPRRSLPHDGPIDAVIVSHLLKREQLRQDNDFYFGALQSQLQLHGLTSLLVLISHLPDAPDAQEAHASSPLRRMILPATVSPATETCIWRQCISASRSLHEEARDARNNYDRRLATLASRQALSASTVINLRMHACVASVCRALDPKIVITTYEGTVAERLIWHAARTASRRPLCVGYQHAMVLPRAHAIRRPVAASGIDCDPDVILTLGEIPHEALAVSAGLQSVRLIEYGSHRRAVLPALPHPRQRPRRCLVLPDASYHECATLFDFAVNCARQSPDISFVLRPHPMVDTTSFLRRLTALQKLPSNASLSIDKALEQEFPQVRYCLYRGSSASMHAVRAGIKPFYLARTGELPFDCLSELGDWRETVTSPEDFLKRISLADQFTDSSAASLAASTCERYISPLRPAALDDLLAMVTR